MRFGSQSRQKKYSILGPASQPVSQDGIKSGSLSLYRKYDFKVFSLSLSLSLSLSRVSLIGIHSAGDDTWRMLPLFTVTKDEVLINERLIEAAFECRKTWLKKNVVFVSYLLTYLLTYVLTHKHLELS